MQSLSILTWNIANPSEERAARQLEWLAEQPDEILVLTESKASRGCAYLVEKFRTAGYAVLDSQPPTGEYGVIIVSRCVLRPDPPALDYLPSRTASAVVGTAKGPLRVVGVYAPSTDPSRFASSDKRNRKQKWLSGFQKALEQHEPGHRVVIGDLNVIETNHRPARAYFDSYEYQFYESLSDRFDMVDAFRQVDRTSEGHSWVHNNGDGYRYDHAFCSTSLIADIEDCAYDHEVRTAKLSDHSALRLVLATAPTALLGQIADPARAAEQDALF